MFLKGIYIFFKHHIIDFFALKRDNSIFFRIYIECIQVMQATDSLKAYFTLSASL